MTKEEAIKVIKDWNLDDDDMEVLSTLIPELKESKDEKISKDIIWCLKHSGIKENNPINLHVTTTIKDAIAWLEKQGEQPNKVSIWKHWKDGIAGNNDSVPTYLIKRGTTYSLSSCLGFECDYIELSELDKLMVEKQGEQKPNFCHHEVNFSNCSEEYRKAYYDGWNNCNQQHEQMKNLQKPTWSEEDENGLGDALWCCKQAASIAKDENEMGNAWYAERWLKSLKKRMQLV